ncbi:MAG: hypothetical protein JWM11_67 [Planctomycetaceae bacterium]|nr:hypothetical protein [Planctomycetaceae bacterium]
MRTCQFLCITLALSLFGCASWHRPSLVYRGQPQAAQNRTARLERPNQGLAATPVELELETSNEASAENENDDETLTPPIEGSKHRSRYQSPQSRLQQDSERRLRDRFPVNPPGNGYVELPPPPEEVE